MSTQTNLIAKQPICNRTLKVVAYELLYRMQGSGNKAHITDADTATIDVLLSAFNDLSITDVVGEKDAFVNFTSNILQGQLPALSPKQLVIELLEDQAITRNLLKTLDRLKKQGYRIALDDFCLNQETISLVDYANIIKLDVLTHPPSDWAEYIPYLKNRGITLLAEKVENYQVYDECCKLGFELFQGYFFAKPKVIAGKKLSNNKLSVLNLLSKLNAQEVDFNEITALITHDSNLSYNLLRTINSGLLSLPSKVESIKHAIAILGLNHLKRWINFLALSSLDDKPKALTDLAMIRAKMCEQLGALVTKRKNADDYFTVGLLSLLDAFFDIPLEQLIQKICLPKAMEDALLHHQGIMGTILACTISYQSGQWSSEDIGLLTANEQLSMDNIVHAYLSSAKWVETLS